MRPKKQILRIDVLTIFPKMFDGVFSESLLGKAQQKGLVDLRVRDLRDHTDDKHRTVDDRPYGGGPGMVMKPEPLFQALRDMGVPAKKKKTAKAPLVIYLSPQGVPFTQDLANRLSREKHLVLLCGHYEGIDERLFEWIDLEICVGDVVYTGGEIPAMAVADAVIRQVPGVVKEADSIAWDSFSEAWKGQLDCPHYTRPAEWRGRKVPDVLLQGNHKAIQEWRTQQALDNTRRKRPDLIHKRQGKIKKDETMP
jgi:tRNA (guanine37-N1)-methyltransferase